MAEQQCHLALKNLSSDDRWSSFQPTVSSSSLYSQKHVYDNVQHSSSSNVMDGDGAMFEVSPTLSNSSGSEGCCRPAEKFSEEFLDIFISGFTYFPSR